MIPPAPLRKRSSLRLTSGGSAGNTQQLRFFQHSIGRKESRRLAAQESGEILGGIVGFQPGGGINCPRELGGVALTEAIADIVAYSREDPLGVGTRILRAQRAPARNRSRIASICVGVRWCDIALRKPSASA